MMEGTSKSKNTNIQDVDEPSQQKETISLRLIENTFPPYEAFQKILGQRVIQLEPIDVGVLNYIFRVTCKDGQVFYLKQALKNARKKDKIGPDLASVNPLRIKYEAEIIQKLSDLFSPEEPVVFPQIIAYDEENNILVSKDLQPEGFLQSDLENGVIDLKVAANLGLYLGRQHNLSFGRNNILRGSKDGDHQNWLLFLNMRTCGVIPKSNLTEEAIQEINGLYDHVRNNHAYDVVINMDCCPKNVLCLSDKRVGIVDLELASGVGDPAYDLGFLIGHYFLFAVNGENVNKGFLHATERILESYLDQIESLPAIKSADFQKRLIKYVACTMIYRVAGSSPAPFINKDSVPKILDIASKLLTEEFSSFKDTFKKFI